MLKTTMTAMIGRESGMMILKKMVILLAPSISAASLSEPGMLFSKKLRAIIMCETARPPGTNMAHTVPIRPVSLTMR